MTMAMNQEDQQHGSLTILHLPVEIISYICSCSILTTGDIFNFAVSHSTFNNYIFRNSSSIVWKAKYIQKYNDWNNNEYEIAINEQNTWKDEIMTRMSINKAVSYEIAQMPSKCIMYKNIPYHVYSFGEELNLNNQSRQYYVFRATLDFYKHLISGKCTENNDILYMAEQFLRYVNQVYFGYKINNFLSLPLAEQNVERGFHLLARWWCPTHDSSYEDLGRKLDNATFPIYDSLYFHNPLHPMFENGHDYSFVTRNGKYNLDHDLYNKANTMIILERIGDFILFNNQNLCYYYDDVTCFSLHWILDGHKGSVFILRVLYESIARRLGVKVTLTATSDYKLVYWTSSWPGNPHQNNISYSVDIADRGIMRHATVPRQLPENCDGNLVSELFWTFSKNIEQFACENTDSRKDVLDFQKLLRPNNIEVESQCKTFYNFHEYCPCPLFRSPLNPLAPKHIDEKFNFYPDWEEIFPSVPKRRGTHNDPKYSIGMLVETIVKDTYFTTKVFRYGVVVGWSVIPRRHTLPNIVYHMLIKPCTYSSLGVSQIPSIEAVSEGRYEKLQRQLKLYNYTFKNIGKFFKYYSQELCAFIPTDNLAQRYPDDHAHTVNSLVDIVDTIN